MSRNISLHHGCERARDLVRAWRRDESGRMGAGHAAVSGAGLYTVYHTTGFLGEQIRDVFWLFNSAMDVLYAALL